MDRLHAAAACQRELKPPFDVRELDGQAVQSGKDLKNHKAGALDKATMRDFDARHLVVPNEIEPASGSARRTT